MEVTFDEYVTGMRHMIMIYVEREDKYILKRIIEDAEAEPSKVSSDHGEVGSWRGWVLTNRGQSYCGKCGRCTK